MSLRLRTYLLGATLSGLLLAAPPFVGIASAQPDEEGDTGEAEEEPAEGEAEEKPAPPPDPPPMEGGWGVGGDEPEGKFGPQGKTGKLKELEDEQEEEEQSASKGPAELPPPGFAYLDTAIGFGDIDVSMHDQGPTNVTPTASFLIGLGYRIGDEWLVYARFPISTGESNGPRDPAIEGARDPDSYKQIATGAFELGVKPHFILSRNVRLPVGLAIDFPSATGDMFAPLGEKEDLGKRIVNLGAAASRGWEDRGLFASKRITFTPSAGLIAIAPDVGPDGRLRFVADMKWEIMIATGGAEPPPPADATLTPQERNDVALNWVTGGQVWWDLWKGLLSPGVKLWLAVATPEESRGTVINHGGAQLVFEPNIATHIPFVGEDDFGMDARVGYMLPMAGDLAGGGAFDSSIGGLRLTAGFFF